MELLRQIDAENFAIRRWIPLNKNDLIDKILEVPCDRGPQTQGKIRHIIIVSAYHYRGY
jgi:hypothetical protein